MTALHVERGNVDGEGALVTRPPDNGSVGRADGTPPCRWHARVSVTPSRRRRRESVADGNVTFRNKDRIA